MNDPHIIYFRCWPGFDPTSNFPFESFNGLPEEDIEDRLEDGARRAMDTAHAKTLLKQHWDELKQQLQKFEASLTIPPGGPRASHGASKKRRPWFAGLEDAESRSGAGYARSVFRLMGKIVQPIEESWIATRRQYLLRIEGADRAAKLTADLQEEFRGERLTDADLWITPIFSYVVERDLSRVHRARLLATESVYCQEVPHDLEEFCRWTMLRAVLDSDWLIVIAREEGTALEVPGQRLADPQPASVTHERAKESAPGSTAAQTLTPAPEPAVPPADQKAANPPQAAKVNAAGQQSVPSEPAFPPVDDEDIALLRALRKAAPKVLTNADLARCPNCPAEKAAAERITWMMEHALAERPKGSKRGATITSHGRALLDHLDRIKTG